MGVALYNNFYLGQVYLLVLFIWMLAYVWAEKRTGTAGALLAFGISVKYFPIVHLPSLVIKKNYRMLFVIAISLIVIEMLSIIIIGTKPCNDFINSVLFDHLKGKLEGQNPYAFAFQSWNSLALNLFSKDAVLNPNPVFDWPQGIFILKLIVVLGLLSMLVYAIFKLRKHPKLAEYSIVLISFLALALSPASASYHLLLLLFPIALLINLQKDNETFIAFLVSSMFVLGFSGILFDCINSKVSFLPFQFYRLILLNSFFVTSIYFLLTGKENQQI